MSSLLEDISEIEMRTYRVDYKDSIGELQRSVFFFNTERHISDLITSYLMTVASIDLDDVEDSDLAASSYTDHQFYGHLLPYISFIQTKFKELTEYCVVDVYKKDGVKLVVNVNSCSVAHSTEPSAEAFQLVKWFNEIQDTRAIPKDLPKYIEEQEAKELLKG